MGRKTIRAQSTSRVIKLVALLVCVGLFGLVMRSGESDECKESMFFGHAIEWLAPSLRQKSEVVVCAAGSGQIAEIPSEVTCALPNVKFVGSPKKKQKCDVAYADLSGLNSFQTDRQVEANALNVRSGELLLQKSNQHRVLTNREREVSVRYGEHVYYSAMGDDSLVSMGGKRCKIRRIRKADDNEPPIYIMMDSEDSVFVTAAKKYARKRGYGFLAPSSSCEQALEAMPESWRKIAYLKLAMTKKRKGWILWLDKLALVTNTEYMVEDLINSPAGKNTLFMVGMDAQPPYLLNVGVLLSKISAESRHVLETIWRCGVMKDWVGPQTYYWDQNALTHLAEKSMIHKEYEYWLKAIRLIPHRMLASFMRQDYNSVERDLASGHWRKGDFIALMTGVEKKDAVSQAQYMVQGGANEDKLTWLRRGEYRYPKSTYMPPMYAVPLSTYFYLEEPTWLKFDHITSTGRHPLNPSCVWNHRGEPFTSLFCSIRTVNYNLNLETGFYEWPEIGKTINHFFKLTPDQFQTGGQVIPVKTKEMYVPMSILSKLYRGRTEGFEDIKLIRHGDALYGICTSLQMNRNMNCEIVLLTLDKHNVKLATPLRGYKSNECHKNWMPFIHDDKLHLIEQIDPLAVLQPDIERGNANPIYEAKGIKFPGLRLRGTSNGINFGEYILFFSHETVTRGKLYAHRWLLVRPGGDWNRKISKPFFIVRKTVEFAIGLRLSEDKSKLIIGLGFEDVKAGFITVKIGSIKEFVNHPTMWLDDSETI